MRGRPVPVVAHRLAARRLLLFAAVALLALAVLVPLATRLRHNHARAFELFGRPWTVGQTYRRAVLVAGIALAALGLAALWVDGVIPSMLVVVLWMLGVILFVTFLAAVLVLGAIEPLLRGELRKGEIDPDEGAAFMAEKRGIRLDRIPRYARAGEISPGTRRLGNVVLRTPGISELADRNEPPFFKNFLKLRVTDDAILEIRCHGVTGWKQHVAAPPVEDCVRIPLERREPDPAQPGPAPA